jgi:hypothetical protein
MRPEIGSCDEKMGHETAESPTSPEIAHVIQSFAISEQFLTTLLLGQDY